MIGRFYELDIDISILKQNVINTKFLFHKDDINSSFISTKILNKGIPIDLENIDIILAHKEGNNKVNFYEIPKENIKDNVVVVPLPFEEKNEEGINIFSLILKNENQKLYTQNYSYRILLYVGHGTYETVVLIVVIVDNITVIETTFFLCVLIDWNNWSTLIIIVEQMRDVFGIIFNIINRWFNNIR